MTPDEVRAGVLDELLKIAPEADPAGLRADESVRDQLDLDSMDQLNFAIALHKRFGIDIPESDAPKLATLEGCVSYITASLSPGVR